MRITIIKGERADRIDIARADGSGASAHFPHKGPIPHDAVHFFVETALGFSDGFWGKVASGRNPDEIAGIAKAAGHASASRAAVPDPAIVEMIQAERAVECFEADLWSGSEGDVQTLREVIAAGCAQSLVPAPALSEALIAQVRRQLRDLREQWATKPPGDRITLEWAGAAS
jgi:hypothetical protein